MARRPLSQTYTGAPATYVRHDPYLSGGFVVVFPNIRLSVQGVSWTAGLAFSLAFSSRNSIEQPPEFPKLFFFVFRQIWGIPYKCGQRSFCQMNFIHVLPIPPTQEVTRAVCQGDKSAILPLGIVIG